MKLRTLASSLLIAGLLAPGLAAATNGYFTHGYGLKNKGRAGVGTAYAEDTFGGANNPATMVFVGNRIDFGADFLARGAKHPVSAAARSSASTVPPTATAIISSCPNSASTACSIPISRLASPSTATAG
jgi:long-chain fatty acid transport protein